MDLAAALRQVQTALAGDAVEMSLHVLEDKLPALDLAIEDVRSVLASASDGEAQNDEGTKWKLFGQALDDSAWAVVIRLRADGIVVVITIHPPP